MKLVPFKTRAETIDRIMKTRIPPIVKLVMIQKNAPIWRSSLGMLNHLLNPHIPTAGNTRKKIPSRPMIHPPGVPRVTNDDSILILAERLSLSTATHRRPERSEPAELIAVGYDVLFASCRFQFEFRVMRVTQL